MNTQIEDLDEIEAMMQSFVRFCTVSIACMLCISLLWAYLWITGRLV